jgi:hypothetical protein
MYCRYFICRLVLKYTLQNNVLLLQSPSIFIPVAGIKNYLPGLCEQEGIANPNLHIHAYTHTKTQLYKVAIYFVYIIQYGLSYGL